MKSMKTAFKIIVGCVFVLMLCHSFVYLYRVANEEGLIEAFIPMLIISLVFTVFGFLLSEMMK